MISGTRKLFLFVTFAALIVGAGYLGKWIAITFSDSGWKRRNFFGLSIETPFRLPETPNAIRLMSNAVRRSVISAVLADSGRASGDIRISVEKLVFPLGTVIDLDEMTELFLATLRKGSYTTTPERTVEALRVSGLDARRYFVAIGKYDGKEMHSTGVLVRQGEELWHVAITFGLAVIRPDAERVLGSIQVEI